MIALRLLREQGAAVRAAFHLRGFSLDAELDALRTADAARLLLLSQLDTLRQAQNALRRTLFPQKEPKDTKGKAGRGGAGQSAQTSTAPAAQSEARSQGQKALAPVAQSEARSQGQKALAPAAQSDARSQGQKALAPVAQSEAQGQKALAPAVQSDAQGQAALRALSSEIEALVQSLAQADAQLRALLLRLPNLPDEPLPERAVLQCVGEPKRFPYEPRRAKSLLRDRGLLLGAQPVLFSQGARLSRALSAFFLDGLRAEGFFECALAALDQEAVFFPPKQQLLEAATLPRYCVERPRAEEAPFAWPVEASAIELLAVAAPSEGRATRARIATLLSELLWQLGLSTRQSALSVSELPFEAAAATLVEIWMPSAACHRPLCIVSAHQDFLARRFGCRCKGHNEARPQPAHSVGCALPLAGVLSALLEHGQNGDGSVSIPLPLRPMMGLERIAR